MLHNNEVIIAILTNEYRDYHRNTPQYNREYAMLARAYTEGLSVNNNPIIEGIQNELKKAKEKHPAYPTQLFAQLAILTEEAGEVAKACNDLDEGVICLDEVEVELMQTAAACIRMLENIQDNDFYKEHE